MPTEDPRYDLGIKGCVRGDPLSWTLHVTAKDAEGDPQPVDLAAYGTWSGQLRKSEDGTTFYDFTVTLAEGAAPNDTFVLTLTKEQTQAMGKDVWKFDLEASTGPLTPFKGAVQIFRDYDHTSV